MIEITKGEPLWWWLHQRTGYSPTQHFRALAAVRGDRVIGMIGLDNWTPGAVFVHIALDDPHAFFALGRPAARFAFDVEKKKRVFCIVRDSNRRVRRLAEGVGFSEVARLPGGWSGVEDLVVLSTERSTCRLLRRGS